MNGDLHGPGFWAELAANVYMIKDESTRNGFRFKYQKIFNMEGSTMAVGKTGAFYLLKKPHVMGFMAVGLGENKNHAFVAFKGTAGLYDALTDLNTGVRACHTGTSVHQGFYYAFESIYQELNQFLSGLQGVTTVHCVGHSLGGAIATLAADWIKSTGKVAQVNLYTFGSPRVGMEMFAKKCTTRLVADNIYRVYHKTDPVPMVPTWPFTHVPASNGDYLLFSPMTAIPWEYHKMKHYRASVEKAAGWKGMKDNRPKGYGQIAVERWLQSDGIVSFTANTLELLDAALLYVIEKVINAAGIVLVTGFATTFTLLDRMAVFMAKAAKATVTVSVWVYHLIKKMAALIGVVVKEGTDLTVDFIRMVFNRVYQKIADMVRQAGREMD
ncbi:MAG: lipase family protein [Cellvibrionaceae bacterium]|nr:lipase family protein [Cellvibrionaceae bacterium]